jgi:hypothetical protein
MRIKPRQVREWLDNLPCLDLAKAGRLASEQLRQMNRQSLPASARLEILGDFLATYRKLAAAAPVSQTDSMAISRTLKHLCQDMGFGYKIVVHELTSKRSGFLEARMLPLAVLGAVHTLGLQLMHYYCAYQRAPRALWGECLALYRYARHIGQERYRTELPGAGAMQIDAEFRLIALLRFADPYCLASGTVTVLRRYFSRQANFSHVEDHQAADATSQFRLHDRAETDHQHRDDDLFLNIAPLRERMAAHLTMLNHGKGVLALGLAAEIPASGIQHTLRQILDHWQTHPHRTADRGAAHSRVELISGLDAAYYMVNERRHFDAALFVTPEQENVIDLGARPVPEAIAARDAPASFICSTTNRSSGGLMVRYRGQQQPHPRVGQVVALRKAAADSGSAWVIAVCRWLIESASGPGFDIGLQYLARDPGAIGICSAHSGNSGRNCLPALSAVQKRGEQRVHTLITRSGGLAVGEVISIYEKGRQYSARCVECLESGPGFDRFIYQPV